MRKKIIKWFLLTFVAAAIVTETVKCFLTVEETAFTDGKHAVFFHAKIRCPTCTKMEELIRQTLDTDFKDELQLGVFDFHVLDYESPESKRIVEQYKIATATVLFFEKKGEEYSNGRNIAESCWKLIGDEQAFKKMIKTELENFIQEIHSDLEDNSEEIELDPELNLFGEE